MSSDGFRRFVQPTAAPPPLNGIEKKSQDNTQTNRVVAQAQQQLQQMQQSGQQQSQQKK